LMGKHVRPERILFSVRWFWEKMIIALNIINRFNFETWVSFPVRYGPNVYVTQMSVLLSYLLRPLNMKSGSKVQSCCLILFLRSSSFEFVNITSFCSTDQNSFPFYIF
jgi:hypothetical protein